MKMTALLLTLFSPFAVAKTLHLTNSSSDLTLNISDNSSAPIEFHVLGNGPEYNGVPGVCEVSGEAKYWVGTDSGLAWSYMSDDKKTMVIIKGRSDGKWQVMSFIPAGICGEGADNSIDGVYEQGK